VSEMTQYRYWLERLKQMSKTTTPADEAQNSAESAGYGSAKSANTDAEIIWRVAAMRPQVPARGPIPFLVARHTADTSTGHCWSCGDALDAERSIRCVPCVLAVEAVLNEVREGAGSGRSSRVNRQELAPISIHIDPINGGTEDVEKNERPRPILLFVSRQAVIGHHIPEHPSPNCQTHEKHTQWTNELNRGECSMRGEHRAFLYLVGPGRQRSMPRSV